MYTAARSRRSHIAQRLSLLRKLRRFDPMFADIVNGGKDAVHGDQSTDQRIVKIGALGQQRKRHPMVVFAMQDSGIAG